MSRFVLVFASGCIDGLMLTAPPMAQSSGPGGGFFGGGLTGFRYPSAGPVACGTYITNPCKPQSKPKLTQRKVKS
jgi:hypothetical protein